MVPVWTNGEKYYSAPDGGFRTYRARFVQQNEQAFINLRLLQSDYVMLPAGKDPYKEITTRSVKFEAREIYIAGVRYRQRPVDQKKRNELLRLLDREPLEKLAAP